MSNSKDSTEPFPVPFACPPEMHAILSTIADGVVVYDLEGRVVWTNGPARALLESVGVDPRAPFAERVAFWSAGGAPLAPEQAPASRALRGETVRGMDIVALHAEPSPIWISAYAAPLRDGSGRIYGAIMTARDVSDRHAMEQQVRLSEEKLQSLISNAPTGIYEIDYRGPRFISVNDVACKILGYTREEMLAMNPMDMLADDSRPLFVERAAKALAGEPIDDSTEFTIVAKDGHLIYTVLHMTFIREAGAIAGAFVIGHDITQRRLAEDALRESEQRLRLALEAAGACLWIQGPDGTFRATPHLAAMLGLPADASPSGGVDLCSMVHPDDLERYRAAWQEGASGVRPYEDEYRIVRPDGSVRWITSKGRLVGGTDGSLRFMGICYDITGRKLAEQATRELEGQLAGVFHRSPVPMAVNLADGTYLEVNQALCDLIGHPREAVLGRKTVDLGVWLDAKEREKAFAIYRSQGLLRDFEAVLRTKAGELRCVLLSMEPVTFKGQDAFIAILRDITPNKRAEAELRRSEERYRTLAKRLREADERKNDFLATLSHELRNPMAAVNNCLEILGRAEPGSGQARRAFAVAERQLGHLTRLVEDLLEVTRITRNRIVLQRQVTDLGELVQGAAEDHRPALEGRGLHLVVELPASPVCGNLDADRIVQVVGNLLHNAGKFTPAGGTVRVSVAADPAERLAVLRVSDTGVGMSAETVSRLFVPFMQADTTIDRVAGGLGLGLALVKGMVELHGGEVAARSDGPGKGSEFVVSLPMVDEPPADVAEPARPEGAGRRVLVIDDNTDLVESLGELLRLEGHEVAAAYDGPGGLAAARAFRPDVVLCDIGLPVMDGYEVARAFRADPALAGTYLVALSGYASPEDIHRSAQAGYDRHLAKPATLDELRLALAQARS